MAAMVQLSTAPCPGASASGAAMLTPSTAADAADNHVRNMHFWCFYATSREGETAAPALLVSTG